MSPACSDLKILNGGLQTRRLSPDVEVKSRSSILLGILTTDDDDGLDCGRPSTQELPDAIIHGGTGGDPARVGCCSPALERLPVRNSTELPTKSSPRTMTPPRTMPVHRKAGLDGRQSSSHRRGSVGLNMDMELARFKLRSLLTSESGYEAGELEYFKRKNTMSLPATPPPHPPEKFVRYHSVGSESRAMFLKRHRSNSRASLLQGVQNGFDFKRKRIETETSSSPAVLDKFPTTADQSFRTGSRRNTSYSILRRLLSEESSPDGDLADLRNYNNREVMLDNIRRRPIPTRHVTNDVEPPSSVTYRFVAFEDGNKITLDSHLSYYLNRIHNFVRNLDEFNKLPVEDRNRMLVNAWPRLLLLFMAQSQFQIIVDFKERLCNGDTQGSQCTGQGLMDSPTSHLVNSLRHFIEQYNSIQITKGECFYLKLISLYRFKESTPRRPLESASLVQEYLRNNLSDLEEVVENDLRYTRLLALLNTTFGLNNRKLERFLFHVTGNRSFVDEALMERQFELLRDADDQLRSSVSQVTAIGESLKMMKILTAAAAAATTSTLESRPKETRTLGHSEVYAHA